MSYRTSSSRTVLNHRGGEKKRRQKSKKENGLFQKTQEWISIGMTFGEREVAHFVRRNVRSGDRTHPSRA